MKLYKISEQYINFLQNSEVGEKISHNKNGRPYVGIVLEIKKHKYFAPLTSKIPQKYNKQSAFRLDNYALIRFNNMIPVDLKNVTLLDIDKIKIEDPKYYDVINKEIRLISNSEMKIKKQAKKVYDNYNKPYLSKVCLDFKILEQKCIEYNELTNKQTPKIKM